MNASLTLDHQRVCNLEFIEDDGPMVVNINDIVVEWSLTGDALPAVEVLKEGAKGPVFPILDISSFGPHLSSTKCTDIKRTYFASATQRKVPPELTNALATPLLSHSQKAVAVTAQC